MTTAEFVDPDGSRWRFEPATDQWSQWDGGAWVVADRIPPGYDPPASVRTESSLAPPSRKWPRVLASIGGLAFLAVIFVVIVLGVR